jgi:hypothetical protein
MGKLRSHWGGVLAMALGNLIFALIAVGPLSPILARALDDRPLAAEVADGADDGPRAELLQDHPELQSIGVEGALLALVVWGVLSLVACGGFLGDERFLAGCLRHGRRMLSVGLVALPLRLLGLAGVLVTLPIIYQAHQFSTVALASLAGLALGGLLWSMVTVTIDRARGKALGRPDLKPWQVLRAGLAASRARLGNTFLLALLSGGGFLLLSAAQLACTHWLPPTAVGSLAALVAMVAGALARAALTAWVLLAAQSSQ